MTFVYDEFESSVGMNSGDVGMDAEGPEGSNDDARAVLAELRGLAGTVRARLLY